MKKTLLSVFFYKRPYIFSHYVFSIKWQDSLIIDKQTAMGVYLYLEKIKVKIIYILGFGRKKALIFR